MNCSLTDREENDIFVISWPRLRALTPEPWEVLGNLHKTSGSSAVTKIAGLSLNRVCCPGGSVGFVFSGYPAGHPSDYLFSLIDLRSSTPVARDYEVFSMRAASAGGAPLLYRPTLLLSRDCSLAVVAGAHPVGGPEPHFLKVIDVLTGVQLPSCELGFSGLDDASDLAARVVDVANNQVVEISVGTTVLRNCTIL